MKFTTRSRGTTLALLLVLICGFVRPASATVIYVSKNARGAVHDGASWATAFTAVQAAIDAAKSGDEVWVAAGTYVEDLSLNVGAGLYGGFVGTETDRTQRNWNANVTNLDGERSTTTAAVMTSAAHGAVLDGFTVQNNYEGISVTSGTATIANCTVIGNWFGISASGGTTHAFNCSISGNIYGIATSGGSLIAANCTISSNNRGFAATATGIATATNCIVAFNEFGIVRVWVGDPTIVLRHCDVYGSGTADYYYLADATGTNGNISADPLFANRAGGDYHLLPGSPCIDAGDDFVVAAGAKDLEGNPRVHGPHVDMGAYEHRAPVPWVVSLGSSVSGGVTVAERIAYVAGADGMLYARSTENGSPIPGFPVDINAAVGAQVKLPSRPAVYYGKTGKAIYLTTDRGDVLRILPNGTVAWHVRPVLGQTVSTPAVTPTGEVFVNLSTGEGPFNNYVFKLNESTGIPLNLSPFLGYTITSDMGDFSPAANNRYLYVNAGWGSRSGLTVLNQDNMVVRSSFAAGEQCLSPLLLGADLILASRGGKVFKMNAITMNPDLGFGHFGIADIGSQISASPFADAAGNVYLGTADGRILKRAPGSANFQPFYTTSGRIGGLTINRAAGVLGFGTSGGSFVQVPLDNPAATTVSPGGPVSTGTVYEALTDRFIVVTDNGILAGYPSVR